MPLKTVSDKRKVICFNGKDKYSHTRCGWVFPKGVAKRCAGFPTSVRGVGWGYPAGNGSDPVEAQGLRIDIKYMKSYEAQTPNLFIDNTPVK
ncbi:MAG: hypothetical protein RXR43_16975 [Sulfolobus sp.]